MEYTGKYKILAEKLQAKGKPQVVIDKFIRLQMERDAYIQCSAESDARAAEIWQNYPEEKRRIWLQNSYCLNCNATTQVKPGYRVKMDEKEGIVIDGKCARCGNEIERYCN